MFGASEMCRVMITEMGWVHGDWTIIISVKDQDTARKDGLDAVA
jgi:hypothetical protein